MIQPQELRIGNYYLGASRGKIEAVTWQTLRDLHEGQLNINPIPITEEWLLKFGYEILRKNEFLFDNYFVAYINEEGKIEMYLFKGIEEDVYLCHIEFVHQLQNLHSSIRKEELQFKQTT